MTATTPPLKPTTTTTESMSTKRTRIGSAKTTAFTRSSWTKM
ncbi:unnamed protein product [Linum tenue]|uniref:Uncharacterized protein n=1 Tax=Linum tenue TaxID=586396 RepID=A0AAV0M810_9ROSI|nr:unnamed protein product [Linum tenue]